VSDSDESRQIPQPDAAPPARQRIVPPGAALPPAATRINGVLVGAVVGAVTLSVFGVGTLIAKTSGDPPNGASDAPHTQPAPRPAAGTEALPWPEASASAATPASQSPTPAPTHVANLSPSARPGATTPKRVTVTGEPGCTATYRVTSTWQGGFHAEVTVTSTGTRRTTRWVVTWTFAPDQAVQKMWSATYEQVRQSVLARSVSWNGALSPGAATTFSLNGTARTGTYPPANVTCQAK
jgi:hypothetical protein